MGRAYVQKQTSCLGISLLIQNVVYDDATGKYNITVLNTGDQQVLVGRLSVKLTDASDKIEYVTPDEVKDFVGNTLPSNYPILLGSKALITVGFPPDITNLLYISIEHKECGKISIEYLIG